MLLQHIVTKEHIPKGWSGDRKYRAADSDGNLYLLRIYPADRFERIQAQFHRMEQVAALGIPMCLPIEFGVCPDGVYSLQSWIQGADAEEVIPTLSPREQYAYGRDAGQILKKLHTIPAPREAGDWALRFNAKIDRKLAMYDACPLKYPGGQRFLTYIEESRHLLAGRPQTYQHGDYHIGNMMIDHQGTLTVIDFDKEDYGDPWEEFNRIVWCAQKSPRFASGMVDGYFAGRVPHEFWALLALYISSNTLSSLPWAIPFGQQEIRVMQDQAAEVLRWYDGMSRTVPTWYASE